MDNVFNFAFVKEKQNVNKRNDCLCAGHIRRRAIAIIRISGPQSIEICERIFVPADPKRRLKEQKGFTIVLGDIKSGDEIIDEVLISIFRAPHSFTGEDSAEISCHASPYIQQKIMELLISHGAVAARPGNSPSEPFKRQDRSFPG